MPQYWENILNLARAQQVKSMAGLGAVTVVIGYVLYSRFG